jgi:hypothetical protein
VLLLPLMLMEKELVDIQLSSTGLLVLPSFALICVYLLRQLEHVIMTIASNGDGLTGAHMSKAIRRGDERRRNECVSHANRKLFVYHVNVLPRVGASRK